MSTVAAIAFAELLKQYRARARVSQEELAERAGVSLRAVSDLERGINRTPRNATIRLLAEALRLSEPEQAAFAAAARGEVLPPTADPAPAHNLPPQLTSFIGRAQDVAAVVRLLQRPDVRLLTLTGPGGVGKTRLALRAAEELLPSFADGVRFVDLASIAEPEQVISAIGQTVSFQETPARSAIEGLKEHLRDHQMLLVLDNLEQVVLAASLIARLLVACPRLKALATSRVRLRVSVEHTYPVAPLTLPDPKHSASVEQVSECEAVRLFIVRAQAARPGFTLTEGNAVAVAEICRRLDGLPLAIELAAARVRLLSPRAMLQRFGTKLTLLTEGARDLPARQQTVRATLDWSYGLLDGAERTLLAGLAVFAGGCELSAAEWVFKGEVDVVADASSLVDSSLLRQEERRGGEVYLRMSETVREYALARLAENGEAEAVRRRHAEYYLSLAEEARLELTGPLQAEWLERLEAEHDNLRAALGWLLRPGEGDAALRLAVALQKFWYIRGHLREGRRWLEETLAATGDERSRERAEALYAASGLAFSQGEFDQAQVLLRESLALSRELEYGWGAAVALNSLARIALERGERERAEVLFGESLSLHREMGNTRDIAIVLANLGEVAQGQGEYLRARELYEESLALRREIGDIRGVAVELANLGSVAHELGEHEHARELFAESVDICRQLGEKRVMALCLEGLAMIAGARDDGGRAARLWGAAEALREAIGMPLPPSKRPWQEREISAARSRTDDTAWTEAWWVGRNMPLERAIEYALDAAATG